MSSASGRIPASDETATPARSKARRSFASGDRLSNPGSSRPEIASATRRTACSAGVPATVSWIAPEANRLRATRNGPRISSSAVIATHVNPAAEASSAAASRSRVLPMPGSPSRVTAARRPLASRTSSAIASSSAPRPMTAPDARRSWTASEHCGPTSGSSAPPSAARIAAPGSTEVASLSMLRIMRPTPVPIASRVEGGRLATGSWRPPGRWRARLPVAPPGRTPPRWQP